MAYDGPLTWDDAEPRKAWSAQLLSSIGDARADLEQGEPDGFAPGYARLSDDLKTKFWAELLIEVARFESSLNPHAIYHEPPPLGIDSVGLFQLSYEDEPRYRLERLDRQAKSLDNPLVNIRCGVAIFKRLVAKDRVVASSAGKVFHGAARYWSVLRAGHHVDDIRGRAMRSVGL